MAYSTIDDPSLHFNTLLYTGNGGTQSITGVGFTQDFTWIKSRSTSQNHYVFDTVRGAQKQLYPSITNAEDTGQSNGLNAFTSDGFNLGTEVGVNGNGATFASWNWKGGGSASNNTDGNKTISLSVNTTAGFSVGTYTGDGQDNTIGHGLGAIPDWLMIKNRSSGSRKWQLWHNNLTGTNKYLAIDRNAAEITDSASWDNTAHSSTVWNTYGSGEANQNGENFVCYAWTSIKGYSKFGSYKGNGNADGSFVYLGFKPAWFMVKRIDAADSWGMFDNKRDPNNQVGTRFWTDEADGESTGQAMDFLSNGFKLRAANAYWNASGGTYVYFAFAESPLVNSEGIPNNAR